MTICFYSIFLDMTLACVVNSAWVMTCIFGRWKDLFKHRFIIIIIIILFHVVPSVAAIQPPPPSSPSLNACKNQYINYGSPTRLSAKIPPPQPQHHPRGQIFPYEDDPHYPLFSIFWIRHRFLLTTCLFFLRYRFKFSFFSPSSSDP